MSKKKKKIEAEVTPKSKVSKKETKKSGTALKIIIPLIVSLVLLELISPIIYNKKMNASFSRSKIQNQIAKIKTENLIKGADQGQYMGIHVLHPFYGFGKNIETRKSANKYALIGPDPVIKKKENELNIAISGGSVANHFFLNKSFLIDELKKYPQYKNTKINIVCLALEGYKQPQQLMVLQYLYFLGAEYDIVLNIDGFNDLALPITENNPSGVNPFFPRAWKNYASKAIDPNKALLLGKMNQLKVDQAKKANTFNKFPLKYSNFMMTLWSLSNQNIENEILLLGSEYESKDGELSFQQKGPSTSYKNQSELVNDVIEKWMNASEQMANICESNDTKYFHMLQPNQYVKNSKPFTDQENKSAYSNAFPGNQSRNINFVNGQLVERYFPLMKNIGTQRAKSNGHHFTDLTMAFSNTQETVYKDACCHLNAAGNKILAKVIANKIVE